MKPTDFLGTCPCLVLLWLCSLPSCTYDYDKFSSEKPASGGQSSAMGGTGGTGAQGGQRDTDDTVTGTTVSSGGAVGSSVASGGTRTATDEGTGGTAASGGSETATGGSSSEVQTSASTSLGGATGTQTSSALLGGAAGASSANVAGSTTAPCLPPRVECNGICTDLDNDAMNCGSCGRACSDSPAEWAVCLGRLCSCDKGATKCAADRECVRNNRCQAE